VPDSDDSEDPDYVIIIFVTCDDGKALLESGKHFIMITNSIREQVRQGGKKYEEVRMHGLRVCVRSSQWRPGRRHRAGNGL